jgi:hypothetical protein
MLPLDKLMLQFEALGDNCEFGLVQREGGAEPLGLLRFAGFFIPVEVRLSALIQALEARFAGLGKPETVRVEAAGIPGQREYLIKESAYELMYHSFQAEGQIDPEKLRLQEAKRLEFLRRKLIDDLRTAAKLLVWKSNLPQAEAEIGRLLDTLGGFGPNTLLWVEAADERHPAGSVGWIAPRLMKGYVDRFAPYHDATNICFNSWFELCEAAFRLSQATGAAR